MENIALYLFFFGILVIVCVDFFLGLILKKDKKFLIITGIIATSILIGGILLGYWFGNFLQEVLQTAVIKGGN